jgi:ribonuclease HI
MPAPSVIDILRHIAREEPLPSTVRAFRGLTREHLGQLVEEAAARLAAAEASAQESRAEVSTESVPGAPPREAAVPPGDRAEARPRTARGERRGN